MRLIDADTYAAEMRRRQENCRAWKDGLDRGSEIYARAEQSFVTFIEAALTLKNQPTIPAIPVDWICEYADTIGSRVRAEIVQEMLDMWAKEQEAR